MYKGNLSRRGFLQRSLAGLAAAGVPAWYGRDLLAAAEDAAAAAKKPGGANDRIVMGAIGIGSRNSRGRDIYSQARGHKNVVYVAACDVHAKHLDRTVAAMKDFNKKDRGSAEVKGYKDFRQLLDDKDINAVTIATPDHWHALVAIEALRRGKDVYCEKPLTLTIEEGKAVAKVAKETGRVFQVGSQQRSEGPFRMACELVRNGRIGKIKRVETRIGANPESPELPRAEVPEGLDWDFWLGPTPKVDYVSLARKGQPIPYSRCEYEFRWWYDYSGGKMTDWGAHHNDIAQWGLGMDGSGPVSVEVVKAKQPAQGTNRYNCHPEFEVRYTYANGAELVCSHTQLPGAPDPKHTTVKGGGGREHRFGHDNGVLFLGEGGKWIFVCRSGITASDPKLLSEPLGPDATHLYPSTNHMGNFLDCVKTRKETTCPAEVGHRSVTVCHLGAIALRSGKKLHWDPKAERFEDEEMNKWLGRPMRDPWKLEV